MKHPLWCVVTTLAIAGMFAPAASGQVIVSGRAGGGGSTMVVTGQAEEIPLGAGSAAITGVVVDRTTQKPIAGAVVSLSAPPSTAGGPVIRGVRQIADEQGRFAFTKLPAGFGYLVTASKFGYFDGGYGRRRQGNNVARRIALVDDQWFADAKVELTRPGSISGRVLDEAGEPVVGVHVRVFVEIFVGGARQIASGVIARTDDRGIYRLANLPPGRYIVMLPSVQHAVPASTPVMDIAGTTPAAVAAAETAGRESPLRRDPALALDPAHRLILGPYPPPPPAGDGTPRAYPLTFYPSARTLSNATAIDLQAGDDRQNVDIQLQPVSTFRVSGRLDGPPDALAGMTLRLLPAGSEMLGRGTEAGTALAGSDGAFTFLNVPAGSYVILASRSISEYEFRSPFTVSVPSPRTPATRMSSSSSSAVMSAAAGTMFSTEASSGSQRYQGRQRVDVGNRDLGDVVVPLLAGATVSGRIVSEQTRTDQPQGLRILTVRAEPANGDPSLGQPRSMRRQDEGPEFAIEGVMPGEYLLRVLGSGLIKSIEWNGRDYTYTPFDLSSGRDITGVVMTLTDQSATISGVARDSSGQPADAAVIYFPVEPAQWRNFGVQPARLRATMASTTGAFSLRPLPAGAYFVVAVEDDLIDAWKDPAFLEAAARVATRVTIDWGETKTQDLIVQRIVR